MIRAVNKYRRSRHQKAAMEIVVCKPEHSFQRQPFAVVLQKMVLEKNGVGVSFQ